MQKIFIYFIVLFDVSALFTNQHTVKQHIEQKAFFLSYQYYITAYRYMVVSTKTLKKINQPTVRRRLI